MTSALLSRPVEELQNLALVAATCGSWQAICLADRRFKNIGYPALHITSSPGAIDEQGNSALHLASMYGHKKVVLELMQLPLPPEARKDVTPQCLWCSKTQFKQRPPYPNPALKKAQVEERYQEALALVKHMLPNLLTSLGDHALWSDWLQRMKDCKLSGFFALDVVLKIFKQMFEHSLGVFAFDHQSGSMLCRVLEMAAQLLQKYYMSLFITPHSAAFDCEQEKQLRNYFRKLRDTFCRPMENCLWGVRLLVALQHLEHCVDACENKLRGDDEVLVMSISFELLLSLGSASTANIGEAFAHAAKLSHLITEEVRRHEAKEWMYVVSRMHIAAMGCMHKQDEDRALQALDELVRMIQPFAMHWFERRHSVVLKGIWFLYQVARYSHFDSVRQRAVFGCAPPSLRSESPRLSLRALLQAAT